MIKEKFLPCFSFVYAPFGVLLRATIYFVRSDLMFEVKKAKSSNKTIRMPDELIEKLQYIADKNDISFNQLVVQCCEYALNDMNKD